MRKGPATAFDGAVAGPFGICVKRGNKVDWVAGIGLKPRESGLPDGVQVVDMSGFQPSVYRRHLTWAFGPG